MLKVLVVVDYQVDFADGALGFPKAVAIDKPLAERIRKAKQEGYKIIRTYDTHFENYLNTNEGKNLPVVHCVLGSKGWEYYGETGKALNEVNAININKKTFGSMDLAHVLEVLTTDENEDEITIEFCGVVTNICVISNAVIAKALLPNANIVINSALCASNDEELEAKALDIMRNLHMEII